MLGNQYVLESLLDQGLSGYVTLRHQRYSQFVYKRIVQESNNCLKRL